MDNAAMNHETPPSGSEKNSGSSGKLEKNLKIVLVACGILLASELGWLFVLNPALPFSRIDVVSPASYSGVSASERQRLLTLAGINGTSSYISVSTEKVRRRLLDDPLVESARVEKRFPDTLSIQVTSRKAAGVALADMNGRSVPVFFDKNGVIFKIGHQGGNIPRTVPIISGLSFENVTAGTVLPAVLKPFLASVERIAASSPELLEAISEIRVQKREYGEYGGYDILVYPEYAPVKMRFASELHEDRLRYAFLQADALSRENIPVDTIDCRTGTASYTLKPEEKGASYGS